MPEYVSLGGNWILKHKPIAEELDKKEVKKSKPKSKVKSELDINKDGKVDKKDASLAGKVLADAKKKSTKKKTK